MQILLAPAKIMDGHSPSGVKTSSEPAFRKEAQLIAGLMSAYTVSQLRDMLNINQELGVKAWQSYQSFGDNSSRDRAVFMYDGMVFKTLAPESMTPAQLDYLNNHLNICSFLYGLLRPLDLINRYRLEGNVELPGLGDSTVFDFWKPILTDCLIDRVRKDDGILVNLASDEMKNLFDWKRVAKEIKVISPTFKVMKNGKPRTVVIYAKMCRGAMTRYITLNRTTDIESLKSFEFEGFSYSGENFDFLMC